MISLIPFSPRREQLFRLAQVLRDALRGVAAHERAHGRHAQQRRRVDAGRDVPVDRRAFRRVGMQVVVIERE
jgi:hypothetical protein